MPMATTNSAEIVSGRLGRLRSGLPAVRMINTTSVCVASDSTNQPVWKSTGPAWKTCNMRKKVKNQHNPTALQANLLTDVAGDQFIVACQDLDLYAITFQRLQHLGRIRLRRISKGQEAKQYHILFVRYAIVRFLWDRAVGHSEGTIPLSIQILVHLYEICTRCVIQRFARVVDLVCGTEGKYALWRPLRDQQEFVPVLHDHRKATTFKVERDLTDLAIFTTIHLAILQDSFIKRAFDPRIVRAIQVAKEQNTVGCLIGEIEMPFQ